MGILPLIYSRDICIERAGHGSLPAWISSAICDIAYSYLEDCSDKEVRASVHVNRHMRVLMNREGGTWKSCRRDTHMTYGHRGRRMEVLPPRYLHLYVTCSVFIYKTEHVQRCVHMCICLLRKERILKPYHRGAHVT